MYVRLRHNGKVSFVTDISKLTKVSDFRKLAFEKTEIPPDRQRLFFRGKQLEDGYTLFDYDVNYNSWIEITERIVQNPKEADQIDNAVDSDDEESKNQDPVPSTSGASSSESVRLQDIFQGNIEDLKLEVECQDCGDDPKKECAECGCTVCRQKTRPELNLMCDECEYCYHIFCLVPPLDSVPDGDWFCPNCRNDADEIVQAGAKLKFNKTKAKMKSMVRNHQK